MNKTLIAIQSCIYGRKYQHNDGSDFCLVTSKNIEDPHIKKAT